MNHIFHFRTSLQFYEYNARRVSTIKFRTTKNLKMVGINDNEEFLLNFYYIGGEVNYEKFVLPIITNSIFTKSIFERKRIGKWYKLKRS